MVEATLSRPEPDGKRGHLTPIEAGDHAARAGVKQLVLTHISDELDEEGARREAAEAFGAAVQVAREGAVYVV
jgi:ribonuclease BN (tRNA processing enzyme)